MKLIVGLGNPGKKYENTRHNAGFMTVDFLVGHFGFPPFKISEKHKAELTGGEIAGEKVLVAKPQTFMNLSGQAVQSLVQFYKINLTDIVVIHDEADLPLGKGRLSFSGSSAGHRGVQSIVDVLGPDFVRLRLGIKPVEPFQGELENYVLGKYTEEEKTKLLGAIKALPSILVNHTVADAKLKNINFPIKVDKP